MGQPLYDQYLPFSILGELLSNWMVVRKVSYAKDVEPNSVGLYFVLFVAEFGTVLGLLYFVYEMMLCLAQICINFVMGNLSCSGLSNLNISSARRRILSEFVLVNLFLASLWLIFTRL